MKGRTTTQGEKSLLYALMKAEKEEGSEDDTRRREVPPLYVDEREEGEGSEDDAKRREVPSLCVEEREEGEGSENDARKENDARRREVPPHCVVLQVALKTEERRNEGYPSLA